jgi:hypothetical protein
MKSSPGETNSGVDTGIVVGVTLICSGGDALADRAIAVVGGMNPARRVGLTADLLLSDFDKWNRTCSASLSVCAFDTCILSATGRNRNPNRVAWAKTTSASTHGRSGENLRSHDGNSSFEQDCGALDEVAEGGATLCRKVHFISHILSSGPRTALAASQNCARDTNLKVELIRAFL